MMLKCYVYDLLSIVSIQNTISWNLWWKVATLIGCVTCECYSKQDACEKICWTWRNHVSRVD